MMVIKFSHKYMCYVSSRYRFYWMPCPTGAMSPSNMCPHKMTLPSSPVLSHLYLCPPSFSAVSAPCRPSPSMLSPSTRLDSPMLYLQSVMLFYYHVPHCPQPRPLCPSQYLVTSMRYSQAQCPTPRRCPPQVSRPCSVVCFNTDFQPQALCTLEVPSDVSQPQAMCLPGATPPSAVLFNTVHPPQDLGSPQMSHVPPGPFYPGSEPPDVSAPPGEGDYTVV